ncbi:hypothetical protein [Nocardia sp. BMG51109]|uniref:hypothetical protein n=1 Tax=Nocardia sp. BMG51109 TaxID=1056816 RepID=UPI0018DC2A4D|nr:hypothetical protein [Nocardia sp. BMG51109]
MTKRNELLIEARLRVESAGSPGHSITRQELADAVNDHVFRATNKRGAVDERHIGKWERGETTWPRKHYRAALRAVLNVTTDAELGFTKHRQSTDDDDVNRKQFLKTTFAASAAMLTNTAPSESDLLDTMAGPTTNYRRMESSVPSDRLWPAVEAHLSLVSGVVRDRLRTASGYRTLSEVAGLAAWLAADRGDDAAARQRYADAISYAERTHHPLLVSYMTASLGHYAVETGDGRAGLALLRTASAQMGQDAPDSAGAWLSSLLAVAYASTGNRKAALAALNHAEHLANRQRGEPQWPWVYAFDSAKAARYQASALGRLGDHRASRAAFTTAGQALGADKPRALAQVEHAHVLASSGDIGGGCALAAEALRVGLELRSERITRVARTFRSSLPSRTTEARQLDDALATLYRRDGR